MESWRLKTRRQFPKQNMQKKSDILMHWTMNMVSIVSCLPVFGLLETDGGKLTRDKPGTICGDQLIKSPLYQHNVYNLFCGPFGNHWRGGEYQWKIKEMNKYRHTLEITVSSVPEHHSKANITSHIISFDFPVCIKVVSTLYYNSVKYAIALCL